MKDTSQIADELIARHVEARGGWDAIMGIRTLRQSGTVQMPNVLVHISGERMRPDLLRIKFSVGDKVGEEGWDGERAWELNGFKGMERAEYVEGAPALALKRGSEFDGPMVGYKEKGYTAEYLGEDEVDGRGQWVVRVVMADGNAMDHFVDKESMLVTKTRAMRAVHGGDEAMTETVYSDYREVAGVLFAFRSWELAKDGVHNEVFTWEWMEANVRLEEGHFAMPENDGV
jgi:hypothetical protein